MRFLATGQYLPNGAVAGARVAFACLTIACACPGARAADTLDELVVTAPVPRTGDVVVEDHVGTRSRIDRETLERRDVTLDDVLAQEAGVQRRRSGGPGTFASITVRAASAAQTSLLLDGVRLNSAGSPVVDLSTLELIALDHVDVYRGVTPLQFGQGTIGGAVNLVTPRVGDGPPIARVGLGIGSFGTRRAEAARVARHGRWETVAALGLSDADNDYPFTDRNATPSNPTDDRRERRRNAEATRAGLLAKVGTRHGENARSDVLVQLSDRRLGVPDWRNSRGNDASFDTGTRQVQLSHVRERVGEWDGSHTLFVHERVDRFDDRDGDVGLGRQDTRTRTRGIGLESYWSRALGPGTFDTKAELRRETLAERDRLAGAGDVDARRHSLLASVRWSLYGLDGRLVVAPALRWLANDDRVRADDRSLDERRGSRSARVLSPEIGARFDVRDGFALHASLGRQAREPSFDELFVDRGLVRGNPGLVAERGVNADIGLEWARGNTVTIEAALFASERDELIATVYDSRGVGRAVNTGRARIVGIELAGAWRPNGRWRVDANATLQDARARSGNRALDGRQLPGEARLALHAALLWRPSSSWLVRLEADALRGRFYDSANVLPARDSLITRLGIERERGRWRVALALDNLGDDNVEDFNGLPRPGRAAFLNVTLTL